MCQLQIEKEFEDNGMTVLQSFDEYGDYGFVRCLHDDKTGIDTDDLDELINFDNTYFRPDDIADLRDYFDRYSSLIEKLAELGLEIRNDSKLCRTYVVDGNYIGPTDGLPENLTDIEKVVEMMKEMEFLFKYTEYEENIALLKGTSKYPLHRGRKLSNSDSDNAKKAALFEFSIQENKNKNVVIPSRLQYIWNQHQNSCKEAYEEITVMSQYEYTSSNDSEDEYY
jgi:hypothetical protein